jgi:asparagine synthase (glutamine-hydrolysing)
MNFSKKGFGIPIRLWFQNELKTELLDLLNKELLQLQNIFNLEYIQK